MEGSRGAGTQVNIFYKNKSFCHIFFKKIFQIVYFDEDGKVSECAWEEENPRGIKKGPIKKSPFLGKGGEKGGEANITQTPLFSFLRPPRPNFSGKGGRKNPSFLPSSFD